uniref:Cadherin domain-containing protein n=1 Tax=Mesocestoides corti TaxID=53468 RepID=A0A5K3FJ60_MESCO
MYTFQIEAYDCDSPPNYSERVLVQVNIRAEEQLRFAEPEYNFSVVTYSSVGAICGKVTVMHESFNHQIDGNNQCGYSLLAGDMVPFTVDSHGVIRTREVLTKDSPKIYIFRVQYRDCGVLRVETVTAVVNIKVIENSCEPRWKGLPQSVYYSLAEPQPKRLLWPQSYTLEMCGMTCEDSPRIVTQVSLNHGRPDMTLYPANPAFCRHDPRSLYEQRKLCG